MKFINKISKNNRIALPVGILCLTIGIIAGSVLSDDLQPDDLQQSTTPAPAPKAKHVAPVTKAKQVAPAIKAQNKAKAPLELKSLMNLSANTDLGKEDTASGTETEMRAKSAQPPKQQTQNKTAIAPLKQETKQESAASSGFFSSLFHSPAAKEPKKDLAKTASIDNSSLSFQILTNEIILKPQDVKDIQIRTIGDTGYGIQINLTDAASNRLESFTESHLNKPCQFVINDTIISLSIIRSAIGTSFVIPAENKAKAERIYHLLVS